MDPFASHARESRGLIIKDGPLSCRFNTCKAALANGNPHEALLLLADIQLDSLAPAAAVLHGHLSSLVSQSIGRTECPAGGTMSGRLSPGVNTIPSLLKWDNAEPLNGVSLVGACMNRQDNLLRALPTWLATDADEIIIVDWSSSEPLEPILAHIDDPRLRVVRIDDETNWILTHAFNIGLRLARHEVVFKLDADIQLLPGFLSDNRFGQGEFVRGFWKIAYDHGQEDQKYVNGSFGARKADLRSLGYYDERIRTYGWDDSNLYARLSHGLGLAGRLLAHGSLVHLQQSEASRIQNQAISCNSFLDWFGPTEFENAANKFHAAISLDWSTSDPAQDYELRMESSRLQRGRRITTLAPHASDERDLAIVLGVRQLVAWHGKPLPASIAALGSSIELARLLKQAHEAGCGPALISALESGKGLVLLVTETELMCQLAEQTIALICMHQATAAEVIVIVTDDGYRPSAADPRYPRVLRASKILVSALALALGAITRQDLHRLEEALSEGASMGCTAWELSAETLASSAIQNAKAIVGNLSTQFREADAPASCTAFVTSVYDEGNLIRLIDYLTCVVLNLRSVANLFLMYEARDGFFQRVIQAMCTDLDIAPGRLTLLPFGRRPTFEELFSVQKLLPESTLLVVGNADVAFDATLSDLAKAALDDHIYILSRWDIADNGKSASLIRLESGIPNIFSADAWIARTPFRPDYRLDYPIGSFHCDSFINNQISRSRKFRWANPCLDIHVFHLHDSRFNSSLEKHVRDRVEIERRYGEERARNGGDDPVKGAPWCHLAQASLFSSGEFLINWRPRALVLDTVADGMDLAALLWLEVLRPLLEGEDQLALVVRMRQADSQGAAGQLIASYKQHYALTGLIFEYDDRVFDEAQAQMPVVLVRHCDVLLLLEKLQQGSNALFVEEISNLLEWPPDSPSGMQMRVELAPTLPSAQTVKLAHALRTQLPEQFERLLVFIYGLDRWTDEFKLLQPMLDDLQMSPRAPALVGLNRPKVSLVTAMFRGNEFLQGYLENVAEAALLADGEVVLVDANCDGHDSEGIWDFFAARPELRRYFEIVQLEQDPGLYNCWRIAIERARGELISNANLDDRRSPQHTLRLVQALQARPALAGAAGSIAAVFRQATGHWFELHPNQIWFHDLGARDFGFDDLFTRSEDGSVRSHNIMHCMPVWRRSLHERFGYFDEDKYGTSADWAFWLTCAREGERFWLDPQAFGRYFVNPASHNRRNDADGAKERRIIADLMGVEQTRVIKQ